MVASRYNTGIMFHRRFSLRPAAWLLTAAVLLSLSFAQTGKRPLNHNDYGGWRSISSQRLSPDGKFLAYGLFPQEGDGVVVVRNLVTGKEQREPAGERPASAPAAPAEEGPPAEARAVTIAFSPDSRTLVFSIFSPKADTDKARKEKKTAGQMPKDGMVIVDLATGNTTRIERVKRFQLPEKANGYLAYLREAPETAPAANPAPQKKAGGGDQQGGRGGRGGGAAAAGAGPRPEFGSNLVLRGLADSTERTFPDVVEFSIADDGKQLVYAVSARDIAKNGVFVARPGAPDAAAAPAALLAGKGKYAKLTWDENQTELAFLSDRDDAKPTWKVYRWDRQAGAAAELASPDTPGFRKEFAISDKGNLSFSKDGTRVFFGCAPPVPDKPAEAGADASSDDKAVVDLWSWKDDYIQPIQKVRAERDRNRTYMAAYLIPERRVVQLGDSAMAEVTPSESAQWVLVSDDREYRPLADYDERYADAYVVDATTGRRTLVAKKHRGTVTWSPSGRYLLTFDGKDWNTISIPDGKTVNLTAGLPVKFWNEDTDTPGTPPAYGLGGWTKDGNSVLLYDRFDIWRVSPDGSGARNHTAGYRRTHNLRLKYVRLETDPRERWIDAARPMLLFAENLKTWESGFFRGAMDGGEPKQLAMGPKYYR